MLTSGQAEFFRQNVNTWIGLAFVFAFTLWIGLTIWKVAVGTDLIADALSASVEQHSVK